MWLLTIFFFAALALMIVNPVLFMIVAIFIGYLISRKMKW